MKTMYLEAFDSYFPAANVEYDDYDYALEYQEHLKGELRRGPVARCCSTQRHPALDPACRGRWADDLGT